MKQIGNPVAMPAVQDDANEIIRKDEMVSVYAFTANKSELKFV